MASKRTIGIGCIIAPFSLLVLDLVAWALVSFFLAWKMNGDMGGNFIFFNILNVILGFLGIAAVIGIPIGLAVGIILMTSKPKQSDEPQNNAKV